MANAMVKVFNVFSAYTTATRIGISNVKLKSMSNVPVTPRMTFRCISKKVEIDLEEAFHSAYPRFVGKKQYNVVVGFYL